MSGGPRFMVDRVEPMRFDGPDLLKTHDLMSPFVWRRQDGRCGILLRVVRDSLDENGSSGSVWYGNGDDGLHFEFGDQPVLEPTPGGFDSRGCEDPTLVTLDDEVIVFYSGVDDQGDGHLLWASGPDVRSLTKRGLAHQSTADQQNVKEAEVILSPSGTWMLGFEYAKDDASRIGYTTGDGPTGPWHETRRGIEARPGKFDSWHLSPGPMSLADPEKPVMFYNGATKEGDWAIGWAEFDLDRDETPHRCDMPLITAPEARNERRMAFAASLLEERDQISMYLSFNDRSCERATVRRTDRPTSPARRRSDGEMARDD